MSHKVGKWVISSILHDFFSVCPVESQAGGALALRLFSGRPAISQPPHPPQKMTPPTPRNPPLASGRQMRLGRRGVSSATSGQMSSDRQYLCKLVGSICEMSREIFPRHLENYLWNAFNGQGMRTNTGHIYHLGYQLWISAPVHSLSVWSTGYIILSNHQIRGSPYCFNQMPFLWLDVTKSAWSNHWHSTNQFAQRLWKTNSNIQW